MERTALLRFDGAKENDPSIDSWFAQRPGPLGAIAQQWFARLRSCGDEVRVLVHDGCPVACLGDVPFGYTHVFRSHVNVGFFYGSDLHDPARLLVGSGKRMRHVRLTPDAPIDSTALGALVEAAFADVKARVEHG